MRGIVSRQRAQAMVYAGSFRFSFSVDTARRVLVPRRGRFFAIKLAYTDAGNNISLPGISWSSLLGLPCPHHPKQQPTNFPTFEPVLPACRARPFPNQAAGRTRGMRMRHFEILHFAMTVVSVQGKRAIVSRAHVAQYYSFDGCENQFQN